MKSVPSPKSTRGSSRQSKSSIEPRGVPEFDREYARQLSLARQGRGSLRESPVSTPRLSPQKAQGESPLPQPPNVGEAIKGFVASHVAPLRGSSGTSSPAPEPQLGKSQEKEILPSLPQSGILRTLSVVVVSILLIMVVALGFAVVFPTTVILLKTIFHRRLPAQNQGCWRSRVLPKRYDKLGYV
ncbi:hypothetical protein ADEAN_000387900 [Angomonas deanei]|uniref:Transmembrane protein n=1 Tax=Angomonas deanei TaxID=59799 RepID=A0A7G2CBU0_9TRYP|nr:hypothetical protein ADEAN_000387900 [Angomonas deanei]